MNGQRVGEASHPGPDPDFHELDDFIDEANDYYDTLAHDEQFPDTQDYADDHGSDSDLEKGRPQRQRP